MSYSNREEINDSKIIESNGNYMNADYPDFKDPFPDSLAGSDIGKFAALISVNPKPKGVVYDPATIIRYVQAGGPMDSIIARHETHMASTNTPMPSGCQWGIAFYLMRRDSGKQGIGFYTVPVIYNPATGTVYDYFDTNNNMYYKRPTSGNPNTYNVYDEGHLWP